VLLYLCNKFLKILPITDIIVLQGPDCFEYLRGKFQSNLVDATEFPNKCAVDDENCPTLDNPEKAEKGREQTEHYS
jgi:hypothetical protein